MFAALALAALPAAPFPTVAPSGSQNATLLADINQEPPPTIPASHPQDMTSIGGYAYFSAYGTAGREPWISDGSEAGTVQLADAFPGFGSSNPDGFTALPNGDVVFAATDFSGRELWITDGTVGGTQMLKDIRPGAGGSEPTAFTEYGGKLYFVAHDGVNGRELWSTDGTPAGTQLEIQVAAGSSGIEPSDGNAILAVSGGLLYFSAVMPFGNGWALWKTDGTQAGTLSLDRITNLLGEAIEQMIDLDGLLVLRAPAQTFGEAIWRSDGTQAGTYPVHTTAVALSSDNNLVAMNGEAFFSADDGVNGRELWKTDGTIAGTSQVIDLQGGFIASSDPVPMAAIDGELFFSASTLANGRELYTTDGTETGTYLIDAIAGSQGIQPSNGVVSDGELVFVGSTLATGAEIFRSDGTLVGTVNVVDLVPGSITSLPSELIDVDGTVFFAADDQILGKELWSTDGVSGASLVADLSPVLNNQPSDPSALTRAGNLVFMQADDGVHGPELWRSDGTAAGTQMVVDLNPGEDGGFSLSLTALGDKVFFLANDGVVGLEPFISDGTPGGTFLLVDVAEGSLGSNWGPVPTIVFDGRVYFSAIGAEGDGLWATDGTPEGTVQIDVPNIDLSPFFPTEFAVLGDRLVFSGFSNALGFELYITDGTSAGTELIVDLAPGSLFGVSGGPLVELDGYLYFAGDDGTTGFELYRTDGTAAGTELVEDLEPGATGSNPNQTVRVGDRVVFTRFAENWTEQVWSTDGNAPSEQIAVLVSGISGPVFSDGEQAFFRGPTPGNTVQLWHSDGTLAGTEMIHEIAPAQGFLSTSTFGAAGNGAATILSGDDGTTGAEVFVSDGTPSGTTLLAEIESGAFSSTPGEFTRLGNQVLFTAHRTDIGRELWATSLVDVGDWAVESYGGACPGSSGIAPTLEGVGDAVVGGAFSFEIDDAAASSAGFLLVGFGAIHGTGCASNVAAPLLIPIATGPTGALSIPVSPSPSFLGLELFAEAVVIDPGGAFLGLASKTAALEVVTGP